MKVLFDANVVIDWLLLREPNYELSVLSIREAIKKGFAVYLSGSSVGDIFYIIRKGVHNNLESKEKISGLLSLFHVAPAMEESIKSALLLGGKDYEDDIVLQIAIDSKIDYLVTNNTKDFFHDKGVRVCTPSEFLKYISATEIDK